MSEEGGNNGGFEEALRRIAQQLSQSVERLEKLDLDGIAEMAGVDAEQARAYLDSAGQWLTSQMDSFASEAAVRFGGIADAMAKGQSPASSTGPHPLDVPTTAQGRALSAIDSGRWAVESGSHVLVATGEGPAPDNALGLVGELRARDWINATGELTLVGQNALKRWIEHSLDSHGD